jgi:hypothetical protein
VRVVLSVVCSLAAGFAAGALIFRGPAAVTPAATQTFRARELTSDPATWPDSPQSTDAKAQRLLAAALREGHSLEEQDELYQAIQALTAADFRRLLTDLGALKEMFAQLNRRGNFDSDGSALLLRRWLQVDGAAAMTWVPRAFQLVTDQGARKQILETLAKERPEELLQLARNRQAPQERAEIIAPALTALAAKDAAKAQAALAQFTDPQERRMAEKAIRRGLVQRNPLSVIDIASAPENRAEAEELMQLAIAAAQESGSAVIRQLVTTPMPDALLATALPALARDEPELALDLAAKCKSPDAGGQMQRSVATAFRAFALQDRARALHKLDEFAEPMRAAAVSGYADGWAAQDPAAALAWLSTLSPGDRQHPGRGYAGSSDMLVLAFDDWIGRDPDQARAWASGLPEGDLRQSILPQLARSYTRNGDPATGLQMLAGMGDAANAQTAKDLARAWAGKDGMAAAEWAVTQAPPRILDQILPMIVETWGDDDEKSVAAWLAQFPAGKLRDQCIVSFLHRPNTFSASASEVIAEFDAWFDTMTDPEQRSAAAIRNFAARKDLDPAAAKAWLSSLTNVGPALQNTLKPRK